MQEFYKKALVALILLLIANALIACFCIDRSYLSATLIPQEGGGVHWHLLTTTDAFLGGTSTIRIREAGRQTLSYDFRITSEAPYPFASAELLLEDGQGKAVPADLARFTTVTFVAKCAPANSLLFSMATFDASMSTPGQFQTYPSPMTYFSCGEQGTPVSLDLTRFTIPAWWFDMMKIDPSRQAYHLDQVAKLTFGISHHSPREVDSHVEISELTLHGRDVRYLIALAVILAVSWIGFIIWFVWAHSRALVAGLESHLKNDMQFVAYRQLTLEAFKDKEKAAILQYIGTHYTDAALDMARVSARIGATRDKINEILKMELGMTFTGYVNQLRLTEAARLLTDMDGKPVADIAYSVGYANVSYFNKLFKEEYGCTPKMFRSFASQAKGNAEAGDTGEIDQEGQISGPANSSP